MANILKMTGEILKKKLSLGVIGGIVLASYLGAAHGDTRTAAHNVGQDIATEAAPAVAKGGSIAIDATGALLHGIFGDKTANSAGSSSGSGESATGATSLNLSGLNCKTGDYSLANGPWGAINAAGVTDGIPAILADNPSIVTAAKNGAQTLHIDC